MPFNLCLRLIITFVVLFLIKQTDEVFMPKDIDLDNGELDDFEKELEEFKRFENYIKLFMRVILTKYCC
jgi:hypothetical protein